MRKENYPLIFLLIAFIATVYSVQFTKQQYREKGDKSPFRDISKLHEIKIPILMYHYVEINKNKNDFLRDIQNVPPKVFEQQIVSLKNAGYKFITPKDLNQIMARDSIEKYVILSFDDGYRDFYTDAYPILKKYNVPAINYIILGFLGSPNYMEREMVEKLVNDNLVEIGSHTFTHPTLTDDLEIAEREIVDSKKQLETLYNINITSFAYPYGKHNDRVINLVKKAGYQNAVTVEDGNIANASNIYTLKRLRPGHLTGENLIKYIEKDFN